MNKYLVKKVSSFEEVAQLDKMEMNVSYLGEYPDIKGWAQVGYDADKLYIKLTAIEKNIRAEEKNPLGSACCDSCLEFFISPMDGDLRYFNIESAASGCIFFGFGLNVETLFRLLPDEDDLTRMLAWRREYTADGWTVEYCLSAEIVQRFFPDFTLESGKIMHANAFKCGDKAVQPHWLSWNEITGKFRFHRPDCFGELTLE